MTPSRSHGEIALLRKVASELAHTRKERLSSLHLLAVIAGSEGIAGDLLRERRLDADAVLKASRSFDDEGPDPISRIVAGAREAKDLGSRATPSRPGLDGGPTSLHVLLSILGDRRTAAHRALFASGVDLARLKARAMQVALGLIATRPRPLPEAPERKDHRPPPPRAGAGKHGPGVVVPLFPPPGVRAPIPSIQQRRRDGARAEELAAPPPADPRGAPPASEAELAEALPEIRAFEPEPLPEPALEAPESRGGAGRDEPSPTRCPLLASIGENLTLSAQAGRLPPLVGRDKELDQVLCALGRRSASSALLVGPAGVGKTALLRGVARALHEVEPAAQRSWVIELVPSELLAEAGSRAAVVERLSHVRREARELGGRVVLAIDEAHELFGLEEVALELRLALSRGELRIVGATTPEELKKVFEASPSLGRAFTVVPVDELDDEAAFELLLALRPELERHHGLPFEDAALADAVRWAVRYLPGRALPDKAITALDLAGARARRASDAARTRAQGRKVAPRDVAQVIAELAEMPIERLLETDGERMLRLEQELAERVVGHDAALERIARILRRNAAGIRGKRPIGSFLLLGPTGVGKTETAKALAEAMFHDERAMTRIDLSEYAEPHSVARLVGAPPGYVGYEAGGQLTEAVRRRPYQVLLLDEIEKAHRDVLMTFLQVLDEGHLTDGRGRKVDFTETVVLLTSNLGSREAQAARAARSLGFAREDAAPAERGSRATVEAARAALAPELLNRIDEVIVFEPLGRADVAEVGRRLLRGLARSLEAQGIELEAAPEVVDALLDAGGFDAEMGARPMRRTLARLVEAPLAECILRGDIGEGDVAFVAVEDGRIVVGRADRSAPPGPVAPAEPKVGGLRSRS